MVAEKAVFFLPTALECGTSAERKAASAPAAMMKDWAKVRHDRI